MAGDGGEEVPAIERVEDDVGARRHGRGSWDVSQECDLAEVVAGAESRLSRRRVETSSSPSATM